MRVVALLLLLPHLGPVACTTPIGSERDSSASTVDMASSHRTDAVPADGGRGAALDAFVPDSDVHSDMTPRDGSPDSGDTQADAAECEATCSDLVECAVEANLSPAPHPPFAGRPVCTAVLDGIDIRDVAHRACLADCLESGDLPFRYWGFTWERGCAFAPAEVVITFARSDARFGAVCRLDGQPGSQRCARLREDVVDCYSEPRQCTENVYLQGSPRANLLHQRQLACQWYESFDRCPDERQACTDDRTD